MFYRSYALALMLLSALSYNNVAAEETLPIAQGQAEPSSASFTLSGGSINVRSCTQSPPPSPTFQVGNAVQPTNDIYPITPMSLFVIQNTGTASGSIRASGQAIMIFAVTIANSSFSLPMTQPYTLQENAQASVPPGQTYFLMPMPPMPPMGGPSMGEQPPMPPMGGGAGAMGGQPPANNTTNTSSNSSVVNNYTTQQSQTSTPAPAQPQLNANTSYFTAATDLTYASCTQNAKGYIIGAGTGKINANKQTGVKQDICYVVKSTTACLLTVLDNSSVELTLLALPEITLGRGNTFAFNDNQASVISAGMNTELNANVVYAIKAYKYVAETVTPQAPTVQVPIVQVPTVTTATQASVATVLGALPQSTIDQLKPILTPLQMQFLLKQIVKATNGLTKLSVTQTTTLKSLITKKIITQKQLTFFNTAISKAKK